MENKNKWKTLLRKGANNESGSQDSITATKVVLTTGATMPAIKYEKESLALVVENFLRGWVKIFSPEMEICKILIR